VKLKTIFFTVSVLLLNQHLPAATETLKSSLPEKEIKQVQNALSQRQQAIIPIAAFAATGNMPKLSQALNTGLEQDLTINEIKEILIQTYAYAGFPRSLNALNEFMQLLEKRKANGIQDVEGKASSALSKDYQALIHGTQNQTQLIGQPVKGALFEFAPVIDEYLKAHLFGDIFSRDILSWHDREIATVSMLAAMSGTEGQLKSHVSMSLNIGITKQQLHAIQQTLDQQVSSETGQKLAKILSK
jgi:alkylhydroperoxidase/carboxymuconolactone decarboxylase family protein YurZ